MDMNEEKAIKVISEVMNEDITDINDIKNRAFFNNNREKLKRDIKNDEMVILASGKEKYFSGDSAYKYRPNKNFYYYLGLNYDDIYYVLFKKDNEVTEKIFFDEVSDAMTRWIGTKFTKEEAINKYGIKEDNIYETSKLVRELKKDINVHDIKKIYLDFLENKEYPDKPDLTHKDNALRSYIENAIGSSADFTFAQLDEITKLHRPYKEEYEIERLKKAIAITDKAFRMVLKNVKTCKTENELEAYLDFSVKKDGSRYNGFEPIVASGKNATVLHYTANDAEIEKDSLILFDIGYEYESYTSDVSRTIPSNGHYTDEQKMIYEIVLNTNKKVIDAIKPKMTFKELNDIAKQSLAIGLFKADLIKSDEEIDKYYFHSVSHPLGLDAHDLRASTNVIEEGMVITVEPGLYIPAMGIGVRIEDDVLVGKAKNTVLTEKIPKEIEEIENIINDKK